jgi:hypothetical protein
MARKVFHSFYYKPDVHRVSQIREMGVIEGQRLLPSNEWEALEKAGDKAIEKWIDEQMKGKSCVVVLAGSETAGRKWVNYEIKKGWADDKGVCAVHIHRLKNLKGEQASKGANPFASMKLDGKDFSSIVEAYNPPYGDSKDVYAYIKSKLEEWIEEAIKIRKNYSG